MATAKKNKEKSTTRRPSRKKKSNNPFRRIPSWVLWSLLFIIVGAYIFYFYTTFVSPYSFRWKALYGTPQYPKIEGQIRGIDVSHYQDEINWDKLRNTTLAGDPISFMFVKATEGVDIIDENFNQNFYFARQNFIVRGAYHFFSSQSPPEKQARFFSKIVQLENEDLPPVLDVEVKLSNDYPKEKLQKDVLTWLRLVERHYGVRPILYASLKYKLANLNTPELNAYPLWLAHYYVDSLKYDDTWHFWQHTDAGRVDGIHGYVDVNIFNGTYEDLQQLTIGKQKGIQDDEL